MEMSTEGRSLQHSETAVCTGFFMNLSILHRQYATCQKELKEPCNNTSNELLHALLHCCMLCNMSKRAKRALQQHVKRALRISKNDLE